MDELNEVFYCEWSSFLASLKALKNLTLSQNSCSPLKSNCHTGKNGIAQRETVSKRQSFFMLDSCLSPIKLLKERTGVIPNVIQELDSSHVKAPGFADHKSPNIRNMGLLMIGEPRGFDAAGIPILESRSV